ncbi:MAG: hypothetical protein HQL36_05930 [Alphaproteobacteria bacterium]|nr:hypothetical protein [Alphaproteobacteria bacterium]MBF0251398.1 hypothetical protein [Alphaproteobacteria bacterium]
MPDADYLFGVFRARKLLDGMVPNGKAIDELQEGAWDHLKHATVESLHEARQAA